jgi:hypothetical protein
MVTSFAAMISNAYLSLDIIVFMRFSCQSLITIIPTGLLLIIPLFCSWSCRQASENNTDRLSLLQENDSISYLQIETDSSVDRWKLAYPVYRFQTGDIDHNGSYEMLVGVIKSTRFDSSSAKRLFIFKNYHGLVRPLWLGSRLGQPLIDFRFVKTREGARIRSIELEKSGNYLVAEYKWRKFGLEFTRYVKREIGLPRARLLLKY